MCRNFDLFLTPLSIEDLFFEKGKEHGEYLLRAQTAIQADLMNRIAHATSIAEDCSKKSTKAGYDAGGMAVGLIPLDAILIYLEQYRNREGALSQDEVAKIAGEIRDELQVFLKVARDGGDLLKTWDSLEGRLGLKDTDLITNWETHVRQASQGDMYSESNAHPHQDLLVGKRIRIYSVSASGETTFADRDASAAPSLFADTHNGDINDAGRYKQFLRHEGFRFSSNSDSCIEPALKRFVYEHLKAGELAGALHRLAFTDPDFMSTLAGTVDANGDVGSCHYPVGRQWANQTLTVANQGNQISFLKNGQEVAGFTQRGFLRDDDDSSANAKINDLLIVAETLHQEGASDVTIAAALTARILEYSHSDNKFVFQSFTAIGKPAEGFLGGGTFTSVRGGSEKGGEEGGEIIFHIPKPYDARNYRRVAFLSASEENALKEQIALLDAAALAAGQTKLAQPEVIKVDTLPTIRATAHITEGVAPVYDVLPGEIVEVTADGRVKLFDIYRGHTIDLITVDEYDQGTARPVDDKSIPHRRHERLAPLKVFQIDYRDLEGNVIPCPFENKYGEEIIVIQPLALQRNAEKLFHRVPDGTFRLRPGADGLGLTMNTDDESLRRERIKRLTHVITGGAGTSFLINTIGPSVARKLGLNTLPVVNLDGFTGSDTIPSYVGEGTLFLANSNSGGTSDTIKLTHEMATLSRILLRIENEVRRRDSSLPEVQETMARLSEIRGEIEAGTEPERLSPHLRDFLAKRTPWVYVVTNIEASALGTIGRGLDPAIPAPAGAGITNLPEEECVGSTFAALASLQFQIALYTFMGEVRGDISSEYASQIYGELAQLPQVARRIVGDPVLAEEIQRLAEEHVGGNFDFVYTGYLDGVPEEQAHKAAEMIQEMFAGWHFFQFQHGKYAHMKRRTRHALGSILGHNAPPPSWSFFNARALKSPNEMGPRVATTFLIAYEGDREALGAIPDYAPDYIFTYPADSMVLYPFQVLMIGHLISYYWGVQKKKIGTQIKSWNEPFVTALLQLPRETAMLPRKVRSKVETHASRVLAEFLERSETGHSFDNIEARRRTAIISGLSLLADERDLRPHAPTYTTGGFLGSRIVEVSLDGARRTNRRLDDATYLDVLKDLAVELCDVEQARQLADHFLTDDKGAVIPRQVSVPRPKGRTRTVYEYDYLIEYEGLGTFYDVEPVHPPKVAKAKKGWL